MEHDPFSGAMRKWGIENTRFDDAFARRAGIVPADLHALEELQFSGGMTPGQLGHRLQLTSGSVTALVDRLERQGLVERRPHPTDRRAIVITLTPEAESFGMETYGPFGEELTALAARLSPQTREEMTAFFTEAAAIAARHAERQAELSRAARTARPVT
jgi:DNA-binding MarR family transcriptional regulator